VHNFVLGCTDLILAVNHKQLLKALGNRKLEHITNPHCRSLKEKSLPFQYKVIHFPGKKHFMVNVMSWYTSGDMDPEMLHLPDDSHAVRVTHYSEDEEVTAMEETLTATTTSIESVTWDTVCDGTSLDPTMQLLHDTILMGFPMLHMATPDLIRTYCQYREDLSVMDGIVLYHYRIMVLPLLHDTVLEMLHATHHGVTSMNMRVRTAIFWPGITSQIKSLHDQCLECHRITPSNPKMPLTPSPNLMYLFESVCVDYFQYIGNSFLILVDWYSGLPEVTHLHRGMTPLDEHL
jgi:hypothetical protein